MAAFSYSPGLLCISCTVVSPLLDSFYWLSDYSHSQHHFPPPPLHTHTQHTLTTRSCWSVIISLPNRSGVKISAKPADISTQQKSNTSQANIWYELTLCLSSSFCLVLFIYLFISVHFTLFRWMHLCATFICPPVIVLPLLHPSSCLAVINGKCFGIKFNGVDMCSSD